MPLSLQHDLKIAHGRDRVARQDFVVALRRYVLNDLAAAMKDRFQVDVQPSFQRREGRPFQTQDEIHKAMRSNVTFQVYSAARYNAQEMSWRSVIPGIADNLQDIKANAAASTREPVGSLSVDPALELPENVAKLDVHLMPGGYASDDALLSGAVYDNGLTVFTAGLLGPKIDDIGQSMARYVKARFADFHPKQILDCGCTIGHNSAPWAEVFPDAEVHAVDVAESAIRYGHARAESMGLPVHFHQMDATELTFPDASMDLVFSSQFLHELSLVDTRKYMAEVYRVLRPGGLFLTMELPPNSMLGLYEQFYLDWDCYYNREPFYRAFRDADAKELAKGSGFDIDSYFYFTTPQHLTSSEADFAAAVGQSAIFDGETGRLGDGIRYFGFGFWK